MGLQKVIEGMAYLGERDMSQMRAMIKKEVKHRIKWRSDPVFRKKKAERKAFLKWSGGIHSGPRDTQSPEEEPPHSSYAFGVPDRLQSRQV